MDQDINAPIITWQGHHGPLKAKSKGFDIIECRVCGFAHATPLPTPDELTDTYAKGYYSAEKPTFLARSAEDQAWADLGWTDRLEIFEALLGNKRRRLLDIGSGPGFFIHSAKKRGWTVKGIEPSEQAAAHARALGLDITEGFFTADTAPTLGRFDAIHLNNVLEHLPDPIGLLRHATDILDSGGLLCIGVPNDFSPFQIAGQKQVGADAWWLAPPHHLNYFNFDSLTGLIERLGFRVEARTTSFPMEQFLMMGENYIGKDDVGRACHARRKMFDLAFDSAGLGRKRREFYRALAECGIGREAVVVGVKQ